jgi:hypothetical protein
VDLVRTDVSEDNISTQRASVVSYYCVVPSSPILITLMMKAIRSSETSAITRATQHHIPEDGILRNHSSENLKSNIF